MGPTVARRRATPEYQTDRPNPVTEPRMHHDDDDMESFVAGATTPDEDEPLADDAREVALDDGTPPPPRRVILHAKLARRVTRGHLWVFSNEVFGEHGDPEPGDEVAVFDHRRRCVGMALYSRSSLIRARIYSRRKGELCDAAFIEKRLREALELRRALGPLPHAYRLANSEADGLPGAVVDVYGDHVVYQIGTFGMDRRREALIEAIARVVEPACVIERSDSPVRALEGLQPVNGVVRGEARRPLEVQEGAIRLLIDPLEGQKTGTYLDQAANRALARPLMAGRRVLDLFCHVGAWSFTAAAAGANEVLAIDNSAPALELARAAAALNPAAEGRVRFEKAELFERLRAMASSGEKYEVVILDPPPLARSKRDLRNALRGYRELNLRAMQLLAPGGLLVTCCCSHAVDEASFGHEVMMAARAARADLTIFSRPMQPVDHAVHLATPETHYLKTLMLLRRDW